MAVKDAYAAMGANYDEVLGRLMSDDFVARFALKFLDDSSFEQLRAALDANNVEEAFRAAHTLKGVEQNLGFTNLDAPVVEIVETLRGGDLETAKRLFGAVEVQYHATVDALKENA